MFDDDFLPLRLRNFLTVFILDRADIRSSSSVVELKLFLEVFRVLETDPGFEPIDGGDNGDLNLEASGEEFEEEPAAFSSTKQFATSENLLEAES